jgi:FAD binding domain/Berberine and berberine like
MTFGGVLGYWASTGNLCTASAPTISPAAFGRLSQKLKGQLVLPSDTSYEKAKRVFYWNARLQSQPTAVVQCGHEDDVMHAVEFARDHHLEVAVRGGGHSYMALSSSNGLVIDLSPLKQISIDPERRILRAQAGVLAGEVSRAAGERGLAPVLGQCPGVGAVGVTLGGGLGWLSGLFGASCDSLRAANIVNANVEKIEASETEDADLLWGMKGAGANFGVTTSFESQLYPIETVVAGDVHFAVADARVVLNGFRELMYNAPDGFQANMNLTQGEAGVFISLCHVGTDAEAESMLGKIRSMANVTNFAVRRQSFASLAEKTAVTSPTNRPVPAFRAVQTVYRSSISDELIDMLTDQLKGAWPDCVFGLSHYMHGEVCRMKPTDTAFPHRHAHSIHIRVAYSWSNPQESDQRFAWGDQWLQQLRPKTNESLYANFQTYQTDVGSPSLFGPNHARLLGLKQKHDPDNFFRRNANIAKGKQTNE